MPNGIYYAQNNETMTGIALKHLGKAYSLAEIVAQNTPVIPGLTLTSPLKPGTAIRITGKCDLYCLCDAVFTNTDVQCSMCLSFLHVSCAKIGAGVDVESSDFVFVCLACQLETRRVDKAAGDRAASATRAAEVKRVTAAKHAEDEKRATVLNNDRSNRRDRRSNDGASSSRSGGRIRIRSRSREQRGGDEGEEWSKGGEGIVGKKKAAKPAKPKESKKRKRKGWTEQPTFKQDDNGVWWYNDGSRWQKVKKSGKCRAAAEDWFEQKDGQRSFGKYRSQYVTKKKAAKAAKPSKKR